MKDYYYILGIQPTASLEEIKSAYRKLSQKFHPDKNDGDSFFTERFKEILEAYEVLKEPDARQKYDRQRSNHSSDSPNVRGKNFVPEIEFFKSDKNSFEHGEEVTFSWKTINADEVEILPLGQVQPVGSKTYRLKNFKNSSLSFEIVARNSFIGRECRATLKLRNETYFQLKKHFQEESGRESGSENHNSNEKDLKDAELDRKHFRYISGVWILAIVFMIILIFALPAILKQ